MTIDLIARGMGHADAQALIKECAEQAEYEGTPTPLAINIGHRIAQAAHKAGFAEARFKLLPFAGLLESAFNGLRWYRDMYPDADSGADDGLYAKIEAALASLKEGQ